MLKPSDEDSRWTGIVGLVFVVAVLAVVLWQVSQGEDVTINARPVGPTSVLAN